MSDEKLVIKIKEDESCEKVRFLIGHYSIEKPSLSQLSAQSCLFVVKVDEVSSTPQLSIISIYFVISDNFAKTFLYERKMFSSPSCPMCPAHCNSIINSMNKVQKYARTNLIKRLNKL